MPKAKPAVVPESRANGHKPTDVANIQKISVTSILSSNLPPQVERRKYFTDENLAGLVKSIQQNGFKGAITVRKVQYGHEIVAGERRWRAAMAAGLTEINADVSELTDKQALEFQLAENLERHDLSPLDEALTYRYMVDHQGYTVQSIAEKFAKTEKIVHRRLKLADLCEQGRKDLAKERLPLAHAELVARFPASEQKEMLKEGWNAPIYGISGGQARPYKDAVQVISRNFLRSLSKAPFDTADANLNKTAGACTTCPKRSSVNQALFVDDFGKEDKCLDGKCWMSKQVAGLQLLREKIAAELPNPKKVQLAKLSNNVPLIQESYNDPVVKLQSPRYVKYSSWNSDIALVSSEKNRCNLTEKGIWISGDKFGQVQLVCVNAKRCSAHKPKTSSTGDDSWKLQSKEREVDEKCRTAAQAAVVRHLSKATGPGTGFSTVDNLRLLLRCFIEGGLGWRVTEFLKGVWPEELTVLKYHDHAKVKAAIGKLNEDAVRICLSQVMHSFLVVETSDYWPELAKSPGINANVLQAEEAVRLAPTKALKEAAEKHLEEIRAGKKSKRPAFYWPKPKAEKKGKGAKA